MEYELKVTRQDLQNTIEELDGNIEELKASNEEAMSVNEELQSSNEELQTSKEELQSLNEELSTVNNQLQDKVEELEEANNDVDNFLRSTNIATLFLDPDLRIKRFTAATTRLFNLLPGDIGRPLTDFSMNFIDPQLGRETRQVIDSLETHERVISDRQGKWYLRRIQPYKTQANHIEGVVVSFVDMTQRIAAEAETRLLATVLSDSNDAIMVVDLGGTIRSWNRGANRLYGYTSEQAVHMNFLDLISEADRPAAAKVLDEVKSGESLDNTELQAITSRGNTVDTLLTATRVVNPHDESCIIAITQHDISQRKQWERQLLEVNRELKEAIGKSKQQLSRSENEFRVLADNVPAQFSYFDTQQRYRYVNKQYGKLWQIPTKDIVDKSIHELLGDDGYRQAKPRIEKALSGEPQEYESQFTIGQKHMIMRVNYVPNVNAQGKVIGVFSLAQDVTELRENEHLQRAQKLRIRAIVDTVSDAILTINEEGVIQDVNTAALHIFDYPADEMLGKFVSSFIVEPKAIEKAPTVTSFVTQWQPDSNAYRYVIGQTRGGRRFPIEGSIREIEHSGIYVIVLRDQSLQRQLEREIIETSTLEQEHIGREIHDGLGQELTAVTMLAVSLQGKLERAHIADFAPDIQRLVEQLQRTLAETRSLSAGLSPIDIGPDGLLDALSTLAERVQSTADIPCHIVASGTVGSLPETTATHLYRIAQEAINNAVKHAKPARIEVQLRNDADNIYLSVSDDGRGLQPKRSGREKLGMHIMRYRASIIGGHLEIASSPGVGTVVRCILPYESINAGESNKV
jgi:two-component system CheB/CheR fusion protein